MTNDPDIALMATMHHSDARAFDWSAVDIALVDATDARDKSDQFPGVGVVRTIRARPQPQPLVIIITGYFLEDGLRRRMAEAGADFFYFRGEVQDQARLRQILLAPEAERRGVPSPRRAQELEALGIREHSRINDAVDFIQRELPAVGASRRAVAALRRRFGELAGVATVNNDGTAPRREQDAPSLSQIERIRRWATRISDS